VYPVSQPGGLAARLRRLRKDASLTQEQMAADLGWVPSKISKIEGENQMPTAEDIERWTARCGHPEDASDLLDLMEDAQTIRRQARTRAGRRQAGQQVSMDERAKAASRIRDAEPMAIPGLLQTIGYARAIAEQVAAVYGAGDIDAAVEARLRRQDILSDRTKEFHFVITEAALRMPPCPVPAMLGQLYHLLDVLDLGNVTLAVIPMGAELRFAPFFGFLMLDDTVIMEDYLGSNETSGEAAAVFSRIFDLLMGQAVTGDEARRLITMAAASLQDSPE
jgi:transcriptional regulator with XRE-family HTH domain